MHVHEQYLYRLVVEMKHMNWKGAWWWRRRGPWKVQGGARWYAGRHGQVLSPNCAASEPHSMCMRWVGVDFPLASYVDYPFSRAIEYIPEFFGLYYLPCKSSDRLLHFSLLWNICMHVKLARNIEWSRLSVFFFLTRGRIFSHTYVVCSW